MSFLPKPERHALVYPAHRFDPEQFLTFVQDHFYTGSFQELGLTDDEQREIEAVLMAAPTESPIVPGTGGIRELLCGIPKAGPGSLHLAVYYAYFPEKDRIFLIDIVVAGTLAPLSDKERAELKALFEECQRESEG